MTEAAHAVLSPSSAERWLQCPASVRMSADVPEGRESVYAREGTAAHALGELLARHMLLNLPKKDFDRKLKEWRLAFSDVIKDEDEMVEHAGAYVDLLRAKLKADEGSVLMLEQKLPTGVAHSWGTSDAVIVSSTIVEIVDLKYGMGVRVDALDNPQLRLYAIGALEAFGDLLGEVETVRMTVFQPRLNWTDTEEMLSADLRAWRDDYVIPIAEKAMGPDAPFGPSETACRWCPVSGNCRAQLEFVTHRDFAPAETLEPQELAEALSMIPHIQAWCAAVQDHCLNRIYSEGQPVPGWKVVMSGGRRSVSDPDAALNTLRLMGYPEAEIATTKVKGIGELEKLLKGDFELVVGPFISKSEGSPSLAPESDSRPSANPEARAAEDFA